MAASRLIWRGRASLILAWFVAAGGVGGCLLYTDDINEPPAVSIVAPSAPVWKRSRLLLSAVVSDDSDPPEKIRLEWGRAPRPCAPPHPRTGAIQTMPRYELVLDDVAPVCVFLTAIDSHGARADAVPLEVAAKNREPTGQVFIARPVMAPGVNAGGAASPAPGTGPKIRLFSVVELRAQGTDEDGDQVRFNWTLLAPGGRTSDPPTCPGAPPLEAPMRRCVEAAAPGRYEVKVVISDGEAQTTAPPLAFEVDVDTPPAIVETDPALRAPLVLIPRGTRRLFEVIKVDDDGEPYPPVAGRPLPTFVWSRAPERGAFVGIAGSDSARLEVRESLFDNPRPGDLFRVRVDVRDRVRQQELEQRLTPLPCPEADDVCAPEGRVRWTTWKVQFYP